MSWPVQPTATRIRTNAQLIDTETGAHLWAEELDNDKTDLLQTQDEIVTRLASTLQIQLTEIETAKLKLAHADKPDVQELALRCEAAIFNTGPRQTGASGLRLMHRRARTRSEQRDRSDSSESADRCPRLHRTEYGSRRRHQTS